MLFAALLISAVTQTAPADDRIDRLPNGGLLPRADPFGVGQAKAKPEPRAKSRKTSRPAEKNSIGMELVLIPPGKFAMGSPNSEASRDKNNEEQVEVTLTKSFYLGRTEVTQGQWRAVMGTTPWKGKAYVREGDDYAATYVSWHAAQAFCKKLSEDENRAYRLPSEAEWEYACRGGTTTRFSFGDDESELNEHAWWGGVVGHGNAKREEYAHEVARKSANAFGLYDMHGNIWEWCDNAYADKLRGGTDPLVSAGDSSRVRRGGAWRGNAAHCRSAARDGDIPSRRNDSLGFRVARSPGQ
jgi:formylglycine-generating enzyme required for sulfatase activity